VAIAIESHVLASVAAGSNVYRKDPYVTEQGEQRFREAMPECGVDLTRWSLPPRVHLASPVELIAANSSPDERWHVFHLRGSKGRQLFLCFKPGEPERFFTNVYIVKSLQQPRPTKFNCVPRFTSGYFAEFFSNLRWPPTDGYDAEGLTADEAEARIRKEHQGDQSEHLIALWRCWEELAGYDDVSE